MQEQCEECAANIPARDGRDTGDLVERIGEVRNEVYIAARRAMDVLRLQDWELRLEDAPCQPDALAAMTTMLTQKRAHLFVSPNVKQFADEDTREVGAHEALHVLEADAGADETADLVVATIEPYVPRALLNFIRDRLNRINESVFHRLAPLLVKLMPIEEAKAKETRGVECPGCGVPHLSGHRDSCACDHCGTTPKGGG